jgi:hypothetical protein
MAHPLAARLAFFERHWAFFGGFGSVCAVAAVSSPFMLMFPQQAQHQQFTYQLCLKWTMNAMVSNCVLRPCCVTGSAAILHRRSGDGGAVPAVHHHRVRCEPLGARRPR